MRLADFKRILDRPLGPGQSVAIVGATAVALPGAMPGALPAIAEGEFLYERQKEFTEIYRRLYDRLVEHAGRFVGPQEAEDAVADAMLSLWRRWPTLSLEQRADPQAVAVFEAGRRYDDISDALDSAISCMPTRRREVLLLVYEQRFTYDEAAQSMGISMGTPPTAHPHRHPRRGARTGTEARTLAHRTDH